MKVFSDDAVTKSDLDSIEQKYSAQLGNTDIKQSKQILQLRVALVATFLINLGVTLYLHLS